MTYGVLAAGSAFLVVYVISYWRLARRRYRPPWLKIWLVGSTAFVSIYSWGCNTWGRRS